MKLSDRLEMIASFVEHGNRLADIGTDHGYVPIYLVQTGRVPSALAMDVRKGPLLRAEEHIREAGLSGRIQTRLSDGLKKLAPGEADTVVIAGMESWRYIYWRRADTSGTAFPSGSSRPSRIWPM